VLLSHREYAQRRARQIAYGRWQPWADAVIVRNHVRRLRATGASYDAIAGVAGVSPMTVHRVLHGKRHTGDAGKAGRQPLARVSAVAAQRLLAVAPATLEQAAVRRDATGARRRLQALIAVGHPPAALAHRLAVAPRAVTRIVRGTAATVSPDLHVGVCELYDRLWDVAAPERTPPERKPPRLLVRWPRATGGRPRWAWMTAGLMILPTAPGPAGGPPLSAAIPGIAAASGHPQVRHCLASHPQLLAVSRLPLGHGTRLRVPDIETEGTHDPYRRGLRPPPR
jgi:hypothetical protein